MDLELTVIPKASYLHIIVTGINNRENVVAYLEKVLEECRSRNYKFVLVEERLAGPRLSIADIFEIASEASTKARGVVEAFAYVDVYAGDDSMLFAETVATNRQFPVKVFSSIDEAEEWISRQPFEESVH